MGFQQTPTNLSQGNFATRNNRRRDGQSCLNWDFFVVALQHHTVVLPTFSVWADPQSGLGGSPGGAGLATPTSASTVTSVGSDAGRGDGVPAPLLRTFSRRCVPPCLPPVNPHLFVHRSPAQPPSLPPSLQHTHDPDLSIHPGLSAIPLSTLQIISHLAMLSGCISVV